MAITSIGYDGTVDEVQWAKLHPAASSRPGCVDVADVSIVTGTPRTVRVNAGSWYGFGVYDASDAAVNLQATAVSSGTRWDTLVLRRDWTTNTSALMLLAGTSSKAIATAVQNNPGVVADQVLYLVRLDASLSDAQELVDLREYGRSMMFFTEGTAGFPDHTRYSYGQPMIGRLAGLGQDLAIKRSSGWDFLLARPWSNLTLNAAVTARSGGTPQFRVVGDALELRGAVNPAGGGKFAADWYNVATLGTSLRPAVGYALPVSTYGLTATTGAARCEIDTAGLIRLRNWDANVTEISLDGVRISLT